MNADRDALEVTMSTAAENLINRRENVLQLADELGSVIKACKRSGMSRSQYYIWRRRYEREGRDGLRDRPPIARNHHSRKPRCVEEKVLGHALASPLVGCHPLAKRLRDFLSIDINGVTVQNILNRHGLGSRYDRVAKVEELVREGKIIPVPSLIEQVGRIDPKFREYGRIGEYPGQLLVQDFATVGDFGLAGRLYVHVCIDSASGYVWSRFYRERIPEAAVELLYYYVRPQCREWDITPLAIETPNHALFYRDILEDEKQHPYRYWLQYSFKYEHRLREKGSAKHNGFIADFLNTARKELFRPVFLAHREWADDINRMNSVLSDWLESYNRRPRPGFPTWGRAPLNIIIERV